ncbi:MAG TPA: ABC transporter ATP-binding protein [Gemmatimonadaceae bacterium]
MIEFRGVGYTYRSLVGRRVRAVDDVTLDIGEGEIVGLAGPNGAGKSTLIAMMLGYLEPTQGTVRIEGLPPRRYIERHGIGYLSELVNIPPKWKLEVALRRYGLLAGVRSATLTQRIQQEIDRLGLAEHRGKTVKQLSKGNLQRLGLAQALLREERVLILDEPTHGLDPVWTQRFRDLVESLRHPERAIFIASHNLDELQRLCDRVAIIDHGTLQRVVSIRATATPEGAAPWRITVVRGAELVPAIFPGAQLAEGEWTTAPLDLETLNAGLTGLLAQGALVSGVAPAHSSLEQQFREAVGVRDAGGRGT